MYRADLQSTGGRRVHWSVAYGEKTASMGPRKSKKGYVFQPPAVSRQASEREFGGWRNDFAIGRIYGC